MKTLLQVLEEPDLDELKKKISLGININQPCSDGSLPLWVIINKIIFAKNSEIYLPVLRFLLEQGADVNTPLITNYNSFIETTYPLIALFKSDFPLFEMGESTLDSTKLSAIQILLEFNPNLEVVDLCKNTPLFLAIRHGEEKLALQLIELGANITPPQNSLPDPLLHLACQHNMKELATVLISQKKVDINQLNNDGKTAINFVAMRLPQLTDIFLLLIKHDAVMTEQELFNSFRYISVNYASLKPSHELLDYFFTQNIVCLRDTHGRTLLHSQTSSYVVEKLLQQGADVHATDNDGKTPLLSILPFFKENIEEFIKLYKLLFRYGANINATDNTGKTVLHHLANAYFQTNITSLITFFLQNNIATDIQDHTGCTALHLMIKNNPQAALTLLEANANPNIINNENKTALECSEIFPYINLESEFAQQSIEIIQILLPKFPAGRLPQNSTRLLLLAVKFNNNPIIEALLQRGQSLNVSENQQTPLRITILNRNLDMAKWLVTNGANVNWQFDNDISLLHAAINNFETFKWLATQGADITVIKDNKNLLDFIYLNHPWHNQEEYDNVFKIIKYLIRQNLRPSETVKKILINWANHYHLNNEHNIAFVFQLVINNIIVPDLKITKSIICFLIKYNNSEILLELINKDIINKSFLLNFSAVHALEYGNTDLFDLLLAQGLNINSMFSLRENEPASRLIEHAFKYCNPQWHEKILLHFIKHNAELHFLSYNIPSFLHIAARRGWIQVLEILLQSQFRNFVNLRARAGEYDESFFTPLQIAVANQQKETVKLLLNYNALVDVENEKGTIPLFTACGQGNLEIAELLLKAGANPNKKAKQSLLFHNLDNSVLYSAITGKADLATKLAFIELLLKHKAQVDKLILGVAILNNINAIGIELLLDKLTPHEIIETKPLHLAISAKNLTVIELLLRRYSKILIHTRNNAGYTPLHMAVINNLPDYYQKLVEHGANPQTIDYLGYLPAHYATFRDIDASHGITLPTNFDRLEYLKLKTHLKEEKEFNSASSNQQLILHLVSSEQQLIQLGEYTYKLIILFSNAQIALNYIKQYRNQNSHQPIHDLCQFNLPTTHAWQTAAWAALVLKEDLEVLKYLHLAPRIEQLLVRPPISLEEIKTIATQVKYNREQENAELATLFHRYQIPERGFERVLDHYQPKQHDIIPNIKIDGKEFNQPNYHLKKLSSNDPLGFVLGAATACCQSIGSAGEACAWHGMTSINSGFYVIFEKVNAEKVKHRQNLLERATQANTFLDFINSKPKLKQDIKEKYNVWKTTLTQQDDKFVLTTLRDILQTELAEINQEKVCAQMWVLLGKNRELLLDSWERRFPDHDKLCEPFLKRLAQIAINQFGFKKVLLGKNGQTPQTLPFPTAEPEATAVPMDYSDYRDSQQQLVIAAAEGIVQKLIQNSAILAATPVNEQDYSSEEFFYLLKQYTKANNNIVILSSINETELNNYQAKLLSEIPSLSNDINKIYILPIMQKNHWSCLVINKQTTTYLDMMGNTISQRLLSDLSNKKYIFNSFESSIASIKAAYENNPFYSSVRLLEMIADFAITGKFDIKLTYDINEWVNKQKILLQQETINSTLPTIQLNPT